MAHWHLQMRKKNHRAVSSSQDLAATKWQGRCSDPDSTVHTLPLKPFSTGVPPLNHIQGSISVIIFLVLPRMAYLVTSSMPGREVNSLCIMDTLEY